MSLSVLFQVFRYFQEEKESHKCATNFSITNFTYLTEPKSVFMCSAFSKVNIMKLFCQTRIAVLK